MNEKEWRPACKCGHLADGHDDYRNQGKTYRNAGSCNLCKTCVRWTAATPSPSVRWILGVLDEVGSMPFGKAERQCPAHPDRAPSLRVATSPQGAVLFSCYAGCDRFAILAALSCSGDRLYRPAPMPPDKYVAQTRVRIDFPKLLVQKGRPQSHGMTLESVHDYTDRARLLRYRGKAGQKHLEWESRRPDTPWMAGLRHFGALSDLPLYRAREIGQAVAVGEPVLLVESESSVDAIRGHFVTTWPGGAGMVNIPLIARTLAGYPHLIVIPDNDEAGLRVLAQLDAAGLAPHVLMPDPGEDARNVFSRCGPKSFAAAVASTLGQHTQTLEAA